MQKRRKRNMPAWLLASGMLPLCAQGAAPPAPFRPFVEVGFEERIRMEEWTNANDWNAQVDDGRLHYRFRSRLWAQFDPAEDLEIMAGIAQENRKIVHPDIPAAPAVREVFVETLYVDYRFSPAWSARLGRQNIQRGEGFILVDPSPADGSRSAYYNALDVTWNLALGHKLECMAISDPGREKYLPSIDDPSRISDAQRLIEWDERALGLYYTGSLPSGATLEGYGFFKTETNDYRPPSLNPARYQPDRRLYTLGARAIRENRQGWTFSGEFALQQGKQDPNPLVPNDERHDISAWAGYARAKKAFAVPWNPSLSLAYIAMSGDDPKTSKLEGWDPIFSRSPKYSELFLYALVPEKGPSYWSNLGMWELEARCSPLPILDLRASYYHMDALESPPAGSIYGGGKNRGNLVEFRADLKLADGFKAHAVVEHCAPGTFYAGKDAGYFLRFEVSYLFKQRW